MRPGDGDAEVGGRGNHQAVRDEAGADVAKMDDAVEGGAVCGVLSAYLSYWRRVTLRSTYEVTSRFK